MNVIYLPPFFNLTINYLKDNLNSHFKLRVAKFRDKPFFFFFFPLATSTVV